ncbi:MAG TPA: hypothetical protein IAB31_07600 [Candidatus Choladousia intestinavium]|uniref:Uncharacterized protein n=1 Tax=Candidatus Choladousia intestinavium TaxID=2840727 RepID=A0A9D1ACL3_9FIRM|nr:hypothetical protein [Candidatus Choladousia intestinavium]
MPQAQLYFLSNEYYQDFPDDGLMKNKDTIDGVPHSRPCFFAFRDARVSGIYWIVPISSKYEKYKRIEQFKIKKYGRCNTIHRQPIRIDGRVAADVEKNARNVLALAKRGAKVIFPDVFKIFRDLEKQLQ